MKRLTAMFMCIALTFALLFSQGGAVSHTLYAAKDSWPGQPGIFGETACLIEASTGAVLYKKQPHKRMYPASITKILTALVTLENADLKENVTFSKDAVYSLQPGDSHMEMQVGESMSVQDCLYGLMLKSANEVAVGLAEHVAGSVKKFAKMMNDRAKQAGALDSNFVNPNGLHDPNHYITAYDMAMITRDAVKNPVFLSIIGSNEYAVTTSRRKHYMVYQRHQMVKPRNQFYYEGCLGGKTGFTDQSGTTLVTCARRNGMTLICVVLNSNGVNVYKDTTKLLDYGFEHFALQKPAEYDTRFQTSSKEYIDMLAPLYGSRGTSIVISADDQIVLPKGASFSDVKSEVDWAVAKGATVSDDKTGTDLTVQEAVTFSDDGSDAEINVTNDDGGYNLTPIAGIHYTYNGHDVGSATVELSYTPLPEDSAGAVTSVSKNSSPDTAQKFKAKFSAVITRLKSIPKESLFKAAGIAAGAAVALAVILFFRHKMKQLNEIRARKRHRNYD